MSSRPNEPVDQTLIIRVGFACLGVIQVGLLLYHYICIPYTGKCLCYEFEDDSITILTLSGINLMIGLFIALNTCLLFALTKKEQDLYEEGPSRMDWYSALFFFLMAVIFGSSILLRKSSQDLLSKGFEGLTVVVNIVAAAVLLLLLGCWDAQLLEHVGTIRRKPATTQTDIVELEGVDEKQPPAKQVILSHDKAVSTNDPPPHIVIEEVIVEQHELPDPKPDRRHVGREYVS